MRLMGIARSTFYDLPTAVHDDTAIVEAIAASLTKTRPNLLQQYEARIAALFTAPFTNSSSSACLPTSRSSERRRHFCRDARIPGFRHLMPVVG
jgi:hypothetical protein